MSETNSKPDTVQERRVTCVEHGAVKWRGDLRCDKCGQVYPSGPVMTTVPDFCGACRARLLPDEHDARVPWSGRPACPECVHGQGDAP